MHQKWTTILQKLKKKFYCKYSTKKSVYNCNVTWTKQQRNNKNIKTAKSWQSFPYSTKYHKIQIIQSVQILIKIQYTRVVCVFHSSRVFCCTEDKAKADPLLFLQRQIQKQPFTTMLSTVKGWRAGYFLLLTTADALIWARIWSRIGLPPSWALPNSRLIGICPKLKRVFWSGGLRTFSTSSAEKTPHCTEKRSVRDRLPCIGTSGEYVAKRHGEKNSPPHPRI